MYSVYENCYGTLGVHVIQNCTELSADPYAGKDNIATIASLHIGCHVSECPIGPSVCLEL